MAPMEILHRLSSFRGEDFLEIEQSEKKNCLWQQCLVMDQDKMSNLYRGPSKNDSYQVSVHLARQFQRGRFFRNQPTRNKYYLWGSCLLTDWNEMSKL
jgi:hypothetical protein